MLNTCFSSCPTSLSYIREQRQISCIFSHISSQQLPTQSPGKLERAVLCQIAAPLWCLYPSVPRGDPPPLKLECLDSSSAPQSLLHSLPTKKGWNHPRSPAFCKDCMRNWRGNIRALWDPHKGWVKTAMTLRYPEARGAALLRRQVLNLATSSHASWREGENELLQNGRGWSNVWNSQYQPFRQSFRTLLSKSCRQVSTWGVVRKTGYQASHGATELKSAF